MIYTIELESSVVSLDFTSLFPLYLSFKESVSNEYYIIGKSKKIYESSLFTSRITYIQGDIALLEDNTYVVFRNSILLETKSINIGNIKGFEILLNSINNQNEKGEINKFMFESETECIPYVLGINNEKEIKLRLENEKKKKYGDHEYYYGIINFSTRGTKSINKVPPLYLNNSYLGDDCSIEGDGYSVKCIIKDVKWYKVEKKKREEKFIKYRVNELYEGCYGPIYTGLNLYVDGNIIQINLFLSLVIITILLF